MKGAVMTSGPQATRWTAVLLIVAAGVVAALQVGKAAIGAPLLQADLGISLTAIGWLTGIFAVLGIVGGIPVGALVGSVGARRLLIAGLLMTAAGAALGALAGGLAMLMLTRVVEGAGFLLIIVAAPSLLSAVARPSDQDLAFALWSCFMPVGMALAMLVGPLLADWRMIWWASSALCVGLCLPGLLILPSDASRRPWSWSGLRMDTLAVLRAGTPVGLAVVFALYSLMFFALFSFLPVLLMERMEVSHQTAGLLSALVSAVNVLGNLAAGVLLSRGVPRAGVLMVACLVMGGAGVGIFEPALADEAVLALCLLFSTVAGLVPATLLASAPIAAPVAAQAPVVIGLIVQGNNLGQILGPTAVGNVIDAHGWGAAAYVVAGASLCAAAVALMFGRRLHSHATAREPHL